MIIQNPLLTGSLNYNGADLSNVTSSNANSASVSLILTAVSSSNQQLSASYIALSGSYNVFSGSASTRVTQIENTYATTGSNSFRADQSITGSLVVSSTITAQTLVVQTVTSSILYSSGSNVFGNQLANTQTFTGSVNITGSTSLNGVLTGTSATFRVSTDRNLATKFDSNIVLSAQSDSGSPESLRIYADTFRIYTSTTAVGLTERFTIANTGAAAFSSNVTVGGNAIVQSGSVLSVYRTDNTRAIQLYTTIDECVLNSWEASSEPLHIRSMGSGGRIQFFTSGSEKMRITSGGNVIVGATTSDLIGSFKFISVGNSGFQYAASSGTYLRIEPGAADTEVALKADARSGGYPPMTFYTGATERLRITSGGVIQFNGGYFKSPGALFESYTSTAYSSLMGALNIGNSYNQANTGDTLLRADSSTANASPRLYCASGSGGVYLTFGATSWTANSDETIKDIIEPITNANDKLKDLRTVVYKLKEDEEGVRRIGLIAQDVEKVLPELVTKGFQKTYDREILGLNYTDLIPVLIKAIQELQSQINELKAI